LSVGVSPEEPRQILATRPVRAAVSHGHTSLKKLILSMGDSWSLTSNAWFAMLHMSDSAVLLHVRRWRKQEALFSSENRKKIRGLDKVLLQTSAAMRHHRLAPDHEYYSRSLSTRLEALRMMLR
jgi:hypothetical protein